MYNRMLKLISCGSHSVLHVVIAFSYHMARRPPAPGGLSLFSQLILRWWNTVSNMTMLLSATNSFVVVTQLELLSSVDTSIISKSGINRSPAVLQTPVESGDRCSSASFLRLFFRTLLLSFCLHSSYFLFHLISLLVCVLIITVGHHSATTRDHPRNSPQDNPPLHLTFWCSLEDKTTSVKKLPHIHRHTSCTDEYAG